ncbi:SDR family NAD(P)-dependent oxidoreductase [Granulicella sp. WH15]|uniref:NAD-dependent epimerase/dehydratase family protein n=1 Tax=Granulicella sp. WH15 TaxID=2602070 RepID=UPI001367222A|nr:SDR family NAD(P)-dependent oxidoreductase [Granulicella sp. WH15]QHN04322.1 SDR family NAD(P)-dependent oxidoreductase [Granulicella sp. WH15]
MTQNILITGGAGFIGTHLAKTLLKQGHTVTLLDNFSPQIHGEKAEIHADLQGRVRLVRGDVRDASVWEAVVPGHQVIVNLAAETGTGQSMYEVMKYEQVNLAGTALLYDLLARNSNHGVLRIIGASSRAIYGEGAYRCSEHGLIYPRPRSSAEKKLGHFDPLCPVCGSKCRSVPTPESAPFQPASFYGLTKQVQEQMTLLFGEVLGIPSFALRYQNVYGPGQSLKNPYTGILAIFSNLARVGSDINVFEDGEESRDFVYIDDVVSATMACIDSSETTSHAVNVGSNEHVTVMQVAQAVNDYFGGKSKVQVNGAFREGDIRHGSADLTLARSLLGYEPKTPFAVGVREFLAWAEQSEPELSGYERSLAELKQKGLMHQAD